MPKQVQSVNERRLGVAGTFAAVVCITVLSSCLASAQTITSVSPGSGPVGTSVTITGTGFGSTQGSNTVKFYGVVASISSWSNTSIIALVPSGTPLYTSIGVKVWVNGVGSNEGSFTVTPGITSLSPTSGAVGASVTITGTNFGSTQGTSTVKFNGTSAGTASSWSATSITVAVPSGATTGSVVVTVSSTASNGSSFTVKPAITSLSPTSAAVGASITVTGTTFGSTQGTSTVTFNGTSAGTAPSWSATSITINV